MNASVIGLREVDPVRLRGDYLDRDHLAVREARRQMLGELERGSAGTVVPLDLSEARLRSSCLSEILGTALERIVRCEYTGRYLVVVDPAREHDFELDAALEKESKDRGAKLVCVWRELMGESALAGQVDPQVQRTYEFVKANWALPEGATARRLKEVERVSIQAAANRLAKSAKLGVIHPAEKVSVSGGGSQWLYIPVE